MFVVLSARKMACGPFADEGDGSPREPAFLCDEPPVGLAPAEAELAATKAAARFSPFCFFRPEGGRNRKGFLRRIW